MEILVLSLVAGFIVTGGLWIATRDTKPVEKHSDGYHSGRGDLGSLADSVKLSADRASVAVDEALLFVRESNAPVDAMEEFGGRSDVALVTKVGKG